MSSTVTQSPSQSTIGGAGCARGGKGDDDDDDDDDDDAALVAVDLTITAINSAASAFAPQSYAAAFGGTARTLDPASYRAQSIASGPPDEMRVTLLQLALDNGPSGPGPTLFDGSAELILTSGSVDLAAAGITLQPIPAGTYTRLSATFMRVGQIKGCVTESFAAATSTMGTGTGPLHGSNVYTSETLTEGEHTFCTMAEHSQLDVETFSTDIIASNATYESNTTPELTEIDLVANNSENLTIAEIRTQSVNIVDDSLNVTMVAGSSYAITLTVDLNRMLRFYANTRADFNPPNPDMKTGTSYFFNSLFWNQTIQVFAGEPGSIEGYPIDQELCPATPCVPDVIGKGWLTLIRTADGDVHNGSVMPNDDNGGGAIKGRVTAAVAGSGGTVNLSVPPGGITGFRFKQLGDPEDSATLTPTPGPYTGTFNMFYHREL